MHVHVKFVILVKQDMHDHFRIRLAHVMHVHIMHVHITQAMLIMHDHGQVMHVHIMLTHIMVVHVLLAMLVRLTMLVIHGDARHAHKT